MPTKSIGTGKKNVTATLNSTDFLEIERLAGVSGIKPGLYARAVLEFAAANGLLIRKNPDDYTGWREAVKKGGPLPEIRLEVVITKPLKAVHLDDAAASDTAAAAAKIICPPPNKFPVQTAPRGPVFTRKPKSASIASLNEDAPKERPEPSPGVPSSPKSGRGLYRQPRKKG